MKETPIPFMRDMVLGVMGGWKTQTRRMMKPQPRADQVVPREWSTVMRPNPHALIGDGLGWRALLDDGTEHEFRCPYGTFGDHLWVRERLERLYQGGVATGLSLYAADGKRTNATAWPWQRDFIPPMFCPRGLSRITLRITHIRVEHLHEITHADCIAEGIMPLAGGRYGWRSADRKGFETAQLAYADLWETLNGLGSWDANPRVWAISFIPLRS